MKKRKVFHFFLAVLLLAIGVSASLYLLHTKPEIKRRKFRPKPPLVKVLKVSPRSYRVKIEGFGTVYPLRVGQIVPEVAGRLLYVSPRLVAGGRFKEGELLVKIDPRDYEAALALAEAELEDARRLLAQVEAESQAARIEWLEILKKKAPPPPLVIKLPQLEAARARVSAAEAKVRKAALDLSRTEIRAPFEGVVEEANVEQGQYVSPGTVLARIYDVSAVEVRVPLEEKLLPWLEIPGFNTRGRGSKAVVRLDLGQEVKWRGRIVRSGARVDEKTRLLDVYVRIEQPFRSHPPLLPGFFTRVEFQGRLLSGVYVIPRRAIHLEEGRPVVWVVKEGRLLRRMVEILYFDREEAVLRKGLKPGDRVVVSRVSGPFPGMRVRIAP